MTGGFISESKNVSFHDKIRNYILINYGLKSQISTVAKKYIEEDTEKDSIFHKDILIYHLEIRIFIDERKKYLKILTGELNDLEEQVMKMIPLEFTPVIIFESIENKPKYL